MFCDRRRPDFINTKRPDKKGSSGIAEPKFMEAVTGQTISFSDGVRMGRKIWTLQGRHRDMVQFSDDIYADGVPAEITRIYYLTDIS